MAFVQGTLGGVSGGVSMQPDILRFPGQCTEQDNMVVDIVDGLRRRGAVEIIALLDAAMTSGDAYVHWFAIEDEDFVAIMTATGCTVYDINGVSYPVTSNGSAYSTYIAAGFNSKTISSVQVGEYNMFANAGVNTDMLATVGDSGDEYVTFHIKDGMSWGVHYEIDWDTTNRGDYVAPAGDIVDATTIAGVSSTFAMTDLQADIETLAVTDGWTVYRDGNTMMLYRPAANVKPASAAAFWKMTDSIGGSITSCTINEIQSMDELPPKTYPGHWVNVRGKDSNSVDDFYMKYETVNGLPNTEGVWKECSNPHERYLFDPVTMPHALVRLADDSFYFTPLDGSTIGGSEIDTWAGREAGDSSSNPESSFVGKGIQDMSIVQQRLVFISDDHVNLSCSAKEFNFWDQSALTGTDTDTIELTTPGNRAAHLFACVEQEQNLVVLGSKTQFALPLTSAITKGNTALVPTTAYDVDTGCKPVVSAGGMFFAFTDGEMSGVREYHTGDVDKVHIAEEITAHVRGYIPPYIKSMHADRQEGIILAIHDDSHDLYRYQFLNQQGSRVISAWSKITLPLIKPISMYSKDGHFFFIAQGDNGLGLYKLLKRSPVCLDYQTSGTVLANGTVSLTSWIFKDMVQVEDMVCIATSGTYAGMRVQVDTFAGGILTLHNHEMFPGVHVTVGVPYFSGYVPTMPVLRDREGKSIQQDRLTVNSVEATVHDTGAFDVYMEAPFYPQSVQHFSGMAVGSSLVVGENTIADRTVHISVGHDARKVQLGFATERETDMIIQSLEYKGNLTKRGTRL